MITDTDFNAFCRRDAPRAIVFEMDYAWERAGAPAIDTLFFSNREDVRSKSSDFASSQRYRPRIIGTPKFKRAIDFNSLGGRMTRTTSSVVLDNADRSLDFMNDLIVDGYEVRVRWGSPKWDLADLRVIQVLVVESITANEDDATITVNLRDKTLLLDRDIKGSLVGGTGINATRYLPLLWGDNENLSPYLYDSITNEYSVLSNFDATTSVIDVREKGLSMRNATVPWFSADAFNTSANAGTNRLFHTAHGFALNDVMFFATNDPTDAVPSYWAAFPGMSARAYWVNGVPSADEWTISATRGGPTLDITGTLFDDAGLGTLFVIRQRYFDNTAVNGRIQLSSTPAGDITVDVFNQGLQTTPFALARALILAYGNVTAADVNSAAFTAADVAVDAKVQTGYISLAVLDRRNLGEVIDELVDNVFGWWGQDSVGIITCGLVDPSGLPSLTATVQLSDADVDVSGLKLANLPPTFSRANVLIHHNLTVQTGGALSDLVVGGDRELYGSEYETNKRSDAPVGTTYAGNPALYHRTMTEAAPLPSLSVEGGTFVVIPLTLDAYANEIVQDRRPNLRRIDFTGFMNLYALTPGTVVRFTYPRYRMTDGVNCRVMEVEVDPVNETIAVALLQYAPPTTVSYS